LGGFFAIQQPIAAYGVARVFSSFVAWRARFSGLTCPAPSTHARGFLFEWAPRAAQLARALQATRYRRALAFSSSMRFFALRLRNFVI
jgi:hypothetical protein